MTTKIQSRDVRDAFLASGPEILIRLTNYAMGFDVNEDGTRGEYNGSIDHDVLLQLVNKIMPIISLEDDQIDQNNVKTAKTIEEVIDLQQSGMISAKQADQYVNILKTNYEITELAQLVERLDDMS